jgi:NAD(P)-dependent dehydrogenase (short-subunit alcohol dehydrogenase family)
MPASNEQTVLITGATDGLGRALAEHVAAKGATVLVHGRDDARGARTLSEIQKATGNERLVWYRADFADLKQVRELGARILREQRRLDVLVSNAGIGTQVPGGGVRQESAQGFELRFAVNYLAGFLLIRDLYPLLAETAQTNPTRIVSVSSAGQAPIDFDNVMLERGYDGVHAYRQSKLAQIMMTFDLAERWERTHVAATALHPSTYMPTKIVPHPITTITDGVNATARLVDGLAADAVNGRYFNVSEEAHAEAQAYDAEARKKLRELSARLVQKK